jgi:hypothetical protein
MSGVKGLFQLDLATTAGHIENARSLCLVLILFLEGDDADEQE